VSRRVRAAGPGRMGVLRLLLALLVLLGAAQAKAEGLDEALGALAGLPGEVSVFAARLGRGEPEALAARAPDRPLAVGSTFKLFILAELVREVKTGERRWTDVVPLTRRSLPSGFLQSWPSGSPLTLHSLAALMISQSDNSAADTLLALVGREKVEALLPRLGVRAPGRLRPFLSTREAFLLKAGDPALRGRWAAAGEAGRRALLAEIGGRSLESVDPKLFAGPPASIDSVEWFASTADVVRTLDWLRRSGDATALALLAINPGLPDLGRGYDYVGYKGGSEGGVLNLSFLLRRKDGTWLAASIGWNDPAARLDEGRMVAATSRLLAFLADG